MMHEERSKESPPLHPLTSSIGEGAPAGHPPLDRSLLQALGDGYFLVNRRFEIVEASPSMRERFGEALRGQKCYDTFLCTETAGTCPILGRGEEEAAWDTRMDAPEGGPLPVRKFARRCRCGGEDYVLEVFRRLAPPQGEGREGPSWTEALEREVERRAANLREVQTHLFQSERLAATGRLAASLAHEINNPLSGIRGCLQTVLEEVEMGEELRRFVKLAVKETDRISGLIRRMNDFQWKDRRPRKAEDVREILREVLLLNRTLFRERKIRLQICFTVGLPKVLLCADEMKQVFLNLVKNAVEAMPRGGCLTVTAAPRGAVVEVRITDTGPGMAKEVKERIFDLFYTTKCTVKGVGLGLPVCWGIVRGHGGRILVESEEGKGSTFVVVLPATARSAAGAKETGAAVRA